MVGNDPISIYLSEVLAARKRGDATEHTYRPALKKLIEAIGNKINMEVTATNEAKREACGAPDFVVSHKDIPLGHIEAKDIGVDLDKIEKTEQLKRYLEGLSSLILTDYLEFRWFVHGEHRSTVKLDPLTGEGAGQVYDLITEFLRQKIKTIKSPADLAKRMAGKARLMRDALFATFKAEDRGGELHGQLKGFRKVLIEDLSEEQFADMYAQTICYGLFAARCNHKEKEPFTRFRAPHELPKTNPFLRETFGYIAGPGLDDRVAWIVDDLAELLDRTAIDRILEDFGRRTRQEDPIVHFYETFLAEYDPRLREARGVYYTPEPVVSYIVRSVDAILKRDFGISDGLADCEKFKLPEPLSGGHQYAHRVTILDPATGTGTFLHEVVALIRERLGQQGQAGSWSGYVSQHLLPRMLGFELLMAPYAVCHMKLGLQLADTGYDFRANERLRVYLTNSLEEVHETADRYLFTQHLAREALEAGEAKRDHPVMVVLGNPPYSGHSANKGKWIHNLLRGKDLLTGEDTHNYFEVDGKPLGERNPKWLNDDYVKFIRFAQWRIERTGSGVLAFITNHGYLDNPTFRGMRQSLMETFDHIYVLDLHGNAKKKEKAPDGTKDANVFDIQQGVAIGIFVKKEGKKKSRLAKVHHADLWGTRETWGGTKDDQKLMGGKYHWLWENDVASTEWETFRPTTPSYWFFPQELELLEEYRQCWEIQLCLPVNVLGFQTHRDYLAVADSVEEITSRFDKFVDAQITDQALRTDFDLKESKSWQLSTVRRALRKDDGWRKFNLRCSYRPFDDKACLLSNIVCDRPRREILDHVVGRSNLCLLSSRKQGSKGYRHCWVSRLPANDCVVSTHSGEANQVFPLYLYPKEEKTDLFEDDESTDAPGGRRPNLAPEFIEECSEKLGLVWLADGTGDLKKTFGPEDIFHYMYAVFHSPEYRDRYADFLRIDFPRLPLTSNLKLFRALCKSGSELVALHLMEAKAKRLTSYPVDGANEVVKVRYTEPKSGGPGRVWINDTQYFQGVPKAVWEFHIGGYQVCQKWLKDRKGRSLSHNDIQHYQDVVAALKRTATLMSKIDKAIEAEGGWPIK